MSMNQLPMFAVIVGGKAQKLADFLKMLFRCVLHLDGNLPTDLFTLRLTWGGGSLTSWPKVEWTWLLLGRLKKQQFSDEIALTWILSFQSNQLGSFLAVAPAILLKIDKNSLYLRVVGGAWTFLGFWKEVVTGKSLRTTDLGKVDTLIPNSLSVFVVFV